MSYQINHTDSANYPSITVEDQTINQEILWARQVGGLGLISRKHDYTERCEIIAR